MSSGYWQVAAEEEAIKRLAFFAPELNQRWKVMHMGDRHLAPTFLAMNMKLQME